MKSRRFPEVRPAVANSFGPTATPRRGACIGRRSLSGLPLLAKRRRGPDEPAPVRHLPLDADARDIGSLQLDVTAVDVSWNAAKPGAKFGEQRASSIVLPAHRSLRLGSLPFTVSAAKRRPAAPSPARTRRMAWRAPTSASILALPPLPRARDAGDGSVPAFRLWPKKNPPVRRIVHPSRQGDR